MNQNTTWLHKIVSTLLLASDEDEPNDDSSPGVIVVCLVYCVFAALNQGHLLWFLGGVLVLLICLGWLTARGLLSEQLAGELLSLSALLVLVAFLWPLFGVAFELPDKPTLATPDGESISGHRFAGREHAATWLTLRVALVVLCLPIAPHIPLIILIHIYSILFQLPFSSWLFRLSASLYLGLLTTYLLHLHYVGVSVETRIVCESALLVCSLPCLVLFAIAVEQNDSIARPLGVLLARVLTYSFFVLAVFLCLWWAPNLIHNYCGWDLEPFLSLWNDWFFIPARYILAPLLYFLWCAYDWLVWLLFWWAR